MRKCIMCYTTLRGSCLVYNTYPNSPENKSFRFCSSKCQQNFIDYVLNKYGKIAEKERKTELKND